MLAFDFKFHNLTIRAAEIEGEPWFLGADVLHVLYGRASGMGNVYRPLAETELRKVKRSHFGEPGGRDMFIISESGLYKLVMRSDKPEAKEFQHWVTSVVLPAIRNDGASPVL